VDLSVLNQITILAPGLLGASLAMAVRREALAQRVHVWARRPETRLLCEEQAWCDAAFATPEEAVKGASLVVMCTPVETLHRLARRIAGSLPEGCIVTDVGSTKSLVCRYCDAFLPETAAFVGSHPMAGSEKSGLEHARADLFGGKPCFVTPLEETSPAAVESVVRFWKSLGMQVVTASPEYHDEIVANISHLPHIIASLLCGHLAARDPQWRHYAGNGLADTTRIASGNPQLWREIIEQNRDEILRAIEGFESELHAFRSALANEQYFEIQNRLQVAKQFRDQLL
jgi:cyclohexadieny/prephenate dehydrogenase